MIDLYTWTTPNGHKLHIMLEECGLEYTAHPINIGNGDQFKPEFLEISPNNKIPAMIDREGPGGKPLSLFESGAMLIYLAGKTGRFLPTDPAAHYETLAWLMFQMASVGPMLGQAHHFNAYAPEAHDYAKQRYQNESMRLYGVMDKRLEKTEYLAGNEYTIADIATMPWLRSAQKQGVAMDQYPHVQRWFDAINARPAVQRGLEVLQDIPKTDLANDKKAWEVMFGSAQYERR